MMKSIFTLIFLFGQLLLFGQKQDIAIIRNDKSPVFFEPSADSEIVYNLNKYQGFFIVENLEINDEWAEVQINPETNNKSVDFINGFILKSEINKFENINHDESEYLSFEIINARTSRFSKEKLIFGLESPIEDSFSVKRMYIHCKDKSIQVDEKYYNDLYNVSFIEGNYSSLKNERFKTYTKGKMTFIRQKCGDGSGSYDIIWVIKDCEIIQRLINEI
ncbi:MAG TPA: hypothetical protein VKY32_02815 [Flavobacterium sp.]|nr:hypothetical protein [Flavobacterium sp.]